MNAPDRIDSYVLADGEKKMVYANDEKIPNAGTFTIAKETHTVGNLLQMQVLRNNQVKYCGYKMPHPLQNSMLVKVQTTTSKATPVAVVGPTPPSPPIVESRTVESRENHEMPSCIFSVGRSRPKP